MCVSVSGCFDKDDLWSLSEKLSTFFPALVWCPRPAERFHFHHCVFPVVCFLLVEVIKFSRVKHVATQGGTRAVAGVPLERALLVALPFRNPWNSFLLKDKLKQSTSPLEG